MTDKRLSLPFMRSDIEWAVECLSNPEYQRRHWLGGEPEEGVSVDTFDESFHTLFDDRPGLAEDPHSTVGDYLIDDQEAEAMSALIAPLDKLLNKFGPLMTPQQAMSDPLWPLVVEKAQELHHLFRQANFVPPPLRPW